MRFTSFVAPLSASLALIPSMVAAAVLPDTSSDKALSERSTQVLYLTNCDVFYTPGNPSAYKASYAAWYADTNGSQNQEQPDALSNEYRDWSKNNGDFLTWPGTYQTLVFPDSGTQITTGIESGADSRAVGAYAGLTWRSDGYQFTCYRDLERVLFGNSQRVCWPEYYCM